MSRFMIQLFGGRREPWVEGVEGQAEKTTVSDSEGSAVEVDDEKTLMIEDRPRLASREKKTDRMPANKTDRMPTKSDPNRPNRPNRPTRSTRKSDGPHEDSQQPLQDLPTAANKPKYLPPIPTDLGVGAMGAGAGGVAIGAMPPPRPASSPIGAIANDYPRAETLGGSVPLVDDPRLGWTTNVSQRPVMMDAAAAHGFKRVRRPTSMFDCVGAGSCWCW